MSEYHIRNLGYVVFIKRLRQYIYSLFNHYIDSFPFKIFFFFFFFYRKHFKFYFFFFFFFIVNFKPKGWFLFFLFFNENQKGSLIMFHVDIISLSLSLSYFYFYFLRNNQTNIQKRKNNGLNF